MIKKGENKKLLKISEKTIIKRNNNLVFKKINEKIYFLDPEKEEFHSLNRTASFIFSLTTRPISIRGIIKKVKDKYSEVSEKDVKSDVLKWVKNYLECGFFKLIKQL